MRSRSVSFSTYPVGAGTRDRQFFKDRVYGFGIALARRAAGARFATATLTTPLQIVGGSKVSSKITLLAFFVESEAQHPRGFRIVEKLFKLVLPRT